MNNKHGLFNIYPCLFHASDLHFHFSTNTKARWWILKSTKQVKCWIRCIYHCTKHQPQKRERGTVESHSVHFNKIKNDWSVPSLAYKYGLRCYHWSKCTCGLKKFSKINCFCLMLLHKRSNCNSIKTTFFKQAS